MNLSSTNHPARGDHLCAAYGTDAEWESLVSEYVKAGLDGGNRVCYFTSERSAEMVGDVLYDNGVNVADAMETGALRIIPDGYPGKFNPEAMLLGLAEAIDEAQADGYDGIRFLGEMGWAATQDNRLEEYERLVTTYYRDRAVDGICLYDKRLFDEDRLERLVDLHDGG